MWSHQGCGGRGEQQEGQGSGRKQEEDALQGVRRVQGHQVQRVPVLPEAPLEETLRSKGLPVPSRSQMPLLCLRLPPTG